MTNLLNVPYQEQQHLRWCGPAALAMVLTYYGFAIKQSDIAAGVMKGEYSYTNDLGRYSAGKGLEAFRIYGLDSDAALQKLSEFIDDGIPPIVLQRPKPAKEDGHFRVVLKIESMAVIGHDPKYGRSRRYPLSTFIELWKAGGPITDDNTILVVRSPQPSLGFESCPYCEFSPFNETFTCDDCKKTFLFPCGFPVECAICHSKWTQIRCARCNRSWNYFAPQGQ